MAIYCFAVLLVVFVYKFRHLRARWGSPGLTALCCTLLFASLTLWAADDGSMRWMDRTFDVTNVWVLLYYDFTTTTWTAAVALALFWRYPADLAWGRLKWIVAAFAAVVAVRTVLFAVSDVPRQRLRIDFLLDYAHQPTVAAFLFSYSVPGLAAMGGLGFWCFSWSRERAYTELPWLRRGLRLYAAAACCYALLCLEEVVLVAVKLTGSDAMDPVGRAFPVPVALAYTALLTGALVIPVLGTRLPLLRTWVRRWLAFFRLRPLHRELRHIEPHTALVAPGRRVDPHHRVRRAVIELNDWRWTLAPLYAPAVAAAAERLGRESGLAGEQLAATVEAAQLKAASRTWQDGVRAGDVTAADGAPEEDPHDGTGFDAELGWWLRVARAYRRSAVVTAALAEAPETSPATAGRPESG